MSVTFDFVNLGENDQRLLLSGVGLAARLNNQSWERTDGRSRRINVAFVDAGVSPLPTAEFVVGLQKSSANQPNERFFAVLPSPPQPLQVLELAKRMGEELLARLQSPSHTAQVKTERIDSEAAEARLKTMHSMIKRGCPFRLDNRDGTRLSYDPRYQHVVSTEKIGETVRRLASNSDWQLTAGLNNDLTGASHVFGAEKLLWSYARDALECTPISWLDVQEFVKLSRWPDFGALGCQPIEMRLTALLATAPLTVEQASTRLNIAPDVVQRFINCCALSGYIETSVVVRRRVPASTSSAATEQRGQKGWIGRFASRLGLLR